MIPNLSNKSFRKLLHPYFIRYIFGDGWVALLNVASAPRQRYAECTAANEFKCALLRSENVTPHGHHFTTKRTDYGRGKGLKLQEIPFAELQRIYEEQAKAKLPLSETEFREVISAETMVFGRKGLGEPQVNETQRILATSRTLASACAA